MQDWARSKNGTDLFVSLAVPARRYSLNYGINPAVVYGIMGHETAFGRFGGILDESFHNWGGIKTADGGANDDPNAHHRFNDHLLGVLAVVQHVAGYAGLQLPVQDLVDPRYHLLVGKRIAAIPSDEWTWASSEHDSNVARYAREMM
ncbi:MAG: glucosaminidase domain-containing protein [Acidimicrobiia bacterium]|nr:glucosaminidase domain-containing protein [Acidimicrobiia bacterium]